MRKALALVTAALALVAIAGCDDDKDKAKPQAGCDEALTRARQMLAVPDFEAARDWSARAKSLCGTEGQKPVAEIDAQIAAALETKKRKADEAAAVIPGIVQEIATYRARKDRAACDPDDDGDCKDLGGAGNVTLNFRTKKGELGALSASTTVEQRGLACDLFGAAEVKKTRAVGENKAYWCAVRSGPLADLELVLTPSSRGTDVCAFSAKRLPDDEYLLGITRAFDAP